MNISKKTWSGFISRLRKIDDRAAAVMVAYMLDHDYASKQGRKELIDFAYAVATKYGEGAAEMACQMYDAVSEASTKRIKPAMPARTATYGEVARTVNGTLLQSQEPAPIGAAVGRLVKTAGVDTTIQNAIRDEAEWAWIPSGDSCPFCMMLASQGWVRASKSVLKGNHASHIHNNCDCTFAIRHDGVSTVEDYDPDALRAQWDAAEGSTTDEKINFLRRKQRENPAVREKINAQKRAAYARRAPKEKMLRLAKQGNTFVTKTDDLFEYAKKIEPIDGFEDIVGHGDPFSMVFRDADGHESNVSAEEFADILEKAGVYKGGKIRLIACQTGAGNGIVPTYLAKRFKTIVMAPTEDVNVDFKGRMILANSEMNAKMGIETGKWVLFGPNGRIK